MKNINDDYDIIMFQRIKQKKKKFHLETIKKNVKLYHHENGSLKGPNVKIK